MDPYFTLNCDPKDPTLVLNISLDFNNILPEKKWPSCFSFNESCIKQVLKITLHYNIYSLFLFLEKSLRWNSFWWFFSLVHWLPAAKSKMSRMSQMRKCSNMVTNLMVKYVSISVTNLMVKKSFFPILWLRLSQ